MVNKANLVERIATLVRDKVIEDIRDIRDESDRHGMRVVIELRNRHDGTAWEVLNRLFKHTALRTTFSVNNLALVPDETPEGEHTGVGQPEQLSLRRLIELFVKHRQVVVRRRAAFDLRKAEARQHLLEGYAIALEKIDDVIKVIRAADDTESARNELMQGFGLTEIQANAILDMQLRRLVRLERDQILEELKSVRANIKELKTTLADEEIGRAHV